MVLYIFFPFKTVRVDKETRIQGGTHSYEPFTTKSKPKQLGYQSGFDFGSNILYGILQHMIGLSLILVVRYFKFELGSVIRFPGTSFYNT